MEDLFSNPEYVKAAATVAALVVMAAVTALITLLSAKFGLKQFQQARYYLKAYYPQLRAQVDQPTDAGPLAFDRLMDRAFEADWGLFAVTVATLVLDWANRAAAQAPAPDLKVNVGWVSSDVAQAMPDGTRQETIAAMGTAPAPDVSQALGVGVGVSDAAPQQEAAG